MSTLKMLLVKKRKLLIGCGVLLVATIAGVVALVAGGKTADATTGSALPPIVNNIEENCKSSNTVTYFPPGYSKYDLSVGASATIGPYSGWYTLGVQENVFAKRASAGECAWEGKSVDNYCYNFSVHEDCTITYNDCPHPHGDPSPAPDGRKRYSISGSVDSNGVCVLSVNPIVSGCTGECICFAKK
ncbi:unnamed protein product [Aphanomyces euteiches]